ncbi:MAG: hypothetical protein ACYDG6_14620 [Thermincolia bacterium]
MAFTGRKHKGSKILTPETVANRQIFYSMMHEIKNILTSEEEVKTEQQMFWAMFEHLSHSSQKEFIEWAKNIKRANF